MITVTKESSTDYPNIRISDGEKSFVIIRKNAPDLYLIPDFNAINDNDDIKFVINESDDKIYSIFEILYHDIINGNVFGSENETKKLKHKEIEQRKENQKLAQRTGLVKDGVIFWHSEDFDLFELSAVLKIEKHEKGIEITFSKNKTDKDFLCNWPTYAIRISESWSIYQSFFCPFVRLHRQLQALEVDKSTYAIKRLVNIKK